jgi:hypothetical protein
LKLTQHSALVPTDFRTKGWGGNCLSQTNLLVVSKGKKILAKIKLKKGVFDIDDVTDFNKSTDNLIQIKEIDSFNL